MFVKNEMTLNFNKAVINTTSTTRLRFYNSGVIGTSMSWQLNGNDIFSMDPTFINIDPYCTGYFTISFKPIAIESYRANLEITYDVPQQQPHNFLKLTIVGEGYVPEVVMIEPKLDTYLNCYNLTFNPVLVNACNCKTITFQNVGKMACKVILEIREDDDDVFGLLPHEDTIEYLNVWKNYGK